MVNPEDHSPNRHGWQRDCDACVDAMIATTVSRSPLAVRIHGLDEVFFHDWRFHLTDVGR